MDPLERSGERCSLDGYCGRSMHGRPLTDLESSRLSSHECVKSMLAKDETNYLANQLIGLSLASPIETNETTSENGTALVKVLVDLSTFDGLRTDLLDLAKIGSRQVNLSKLSAHLPAQDADVPLEALGDEWQVTLSVLYSVTAVVSILLNLITVIVLYRAKPSELRKYLINLAISDLCMSLFSIPFTYRDYMLGYWDYPPFLCPVVRLMVTLDVYVCVCTMVVIGVNRHVAILYPMKKCSVGGWKCGKSWVILGIWLSGLVIALPEYLMFGATHFCYNKKFHHSCRNTWGQPFEYYYTIFLFLTTFVIPFMLLCYFYSSIGIQLKHREMPGNANASRDLSMQTKRAKVVKMLIVVVVMFVIFWLPLQTFNLIVWVWPAVREVGEHGGAFYNLFVGTYFTFHWMSMAHSCLNPLIYCFMNPNFRKDLRDLICSSQWAGCGKGPLRRRNRHFGSQSTSTLRHQSHHQHNWSLRSNKQQEQFAHCVRLKLDALKRIDKLNGNSLDEERDPSTRQSLQRKLSVQESRSSEPIRSRNDGSPAAHSNHVTTSGTAANGLPADTLKVNNNESETTPDGEPPLTTTPPQREILARGESASLTGQLAGRCERSPARRSIEIAMLPEVSEEEEGDEDAGREDANEVGLDVAGPTGIGSSQLVAPAESEPSAACDSQASSHELAYQQQQAPASQNKTTVRSEGKLTAGYRKRVGKLTRLIRSLPGSGALFGSANNAAGPSQTHEANITNV